MMCRGCSSVSDVNGDDSVAEWGNEDVNKVRLCCVGLGWGGWGWVGLCCVVLCWVE